MHWVNGYTLPSAAGRSREGETATHMKNKEALEQWVDCLKQARKVLPGYFDSKTDDNVARGCR